jgi:hypothetical protein
MPGEVNTEAGWRMAQCKESFLTVSELQVVGKEPHSDSSAARQFEYVEKFSVPFLFCLRPEYLFVSIQICCR